jgi:hypothetical protein
VRSAEAIGKTHLSRIRDMLEDLGNLPRQGISDKPDNLPSPLVTKELRDPDEQAR